MAQITPLTLADGQPTPVVRTFSPVRVDGQGVASWQDRQSGVPLGYPALTMLLRPPPKNGTAYKVTGKLTLPILNPTAADKPVSVAFNILGTFEFVLPVSSTLAQRKDVLALVKNALATACITDAVTMQEFVY